MQMAGSWASVGLAVSRQPSAKSSLPRRRIDAAQGLEANGIA
jgi:hypothetical protein